MVWTGIPFGSMNDVDECSLLRLITDRTIMRGQYASCSEYISDVTLVSFFI